jgi:hypothetical protein
MGMAEHGMTAVNGNGLCGEGEWKWQTRNGSLPFTALISSRGNLLSFIYTVSFFVRLIHGSKCSTRFGPFCGPLEWPNGPTHWLTTLL